MPAFRRNIPSASSVVKTYRWLKVLSSRIYTEIISDDLNFLNTFSTLQGFDVCTLTIIISGKSVQTLGNKSLRCLYALKLTVQSPSTCNLVYVGLSFDILCLCVTSAAICILPKYNSY
jgi:hypothetical protein